MALKSYVIIPALISLGILVSFAASAQEEIFAPAIPKVKCEELKKMIDSKATDFLAVSNDPQESYDEGHIPGAVSFPWAEKLKMPVNLPHDKILILYCSCAQEEDSTDTAAKLARIGYTKIKVLEGGFIKWSELKYPIEKTN
jgi:rhodanese-related sulfurtransferase